MKIVIVALIVLISRASSAFETLNYDCSVWKLPDVEEALNNETNARIAQVLERQSGCDEATLLQGLQARLANAWIDNLETWADAAPIARCQVPASESVYQDFTIWDSPIGIAAGLKSVLNIAGVYVGTDKLSHFMTEGFEYYSKIQNGATLTDILNQGLQEENGIYGITTTGVRSYGDMSANYLGFLFWSELLGGAHPLIACKDGKWSVERRFQWRNYVNDMLDESINCNEFTTVRMEKLVDARTAILRKKARVTPLTCPLKPKSCSELNRVITEPARDFLLSKRCRDVGD